jgi:2-polyprenyl-3-methyl-5-hydroxy-6-metoxy-1,4-benzoquinol methylase
MDFGDVAKRLLPNTTVDRLRAYRDSRKELPGEKDADWYDRALEKSETYDKHYTESLYYAIWTVLIDRLRKHGSAKILEIGCGTGQLAWALRDSDLLKDYCGFDFSPNRVAMARRNCPDLRFEIADVFDTNIFEIFSYELVISTEFLEHVNQDLKVIERIRPETFFLATVPNYPWTSHVRHFESCEQVEERYSDYFVDLQVSPILRRKDGKVIFVMEGRKK